MKKNRKQTALAKCVLATIMAMGMMGYTTVWADTPTPSPVDKDVSKDAAGQIYDASHNYDKGYFWTDLGHAQVQIGSGEQIELFTPFIYHTNTRVWDPTSNSYNPVHTGDNSEMKCKESMSRITVGEFDRIIKSLYTNDITMAKTIYGEGDQAGLKDKVIKEVKATPGQGATVNTYKLVRENGTDVAVGIVDTDTKVVDNKLTFTDGKLTSKITDNASGIFESTVEGIASQEWVNNQLNGIGGTDTVTTAESGHAIITVVDAYADDPTTNNKHHRIGINEDALRGFIQDAAAAQDTNTTNTSMEGNLDEYGKLTVRVNDSAGNNVQAVVEDVASRSWVTNQLENVADTNTVTTVAVNTNILTIEDKGADGNHAYELGINSEQLGDFVKQYDTNTITTVQDDGNGYVTVGDMTDDKGNHAYTVSFNEQKLNAAIEAQDRYVTSGSIGEDGRITLNVHNGRDVTLEGQMKDARLTDIERDKEAGTATLVVKDRYNPEEVNRLTIDDIASKAQNDREHAEFREHFNELDHRVDNLGSRVDKVGAGAAALAALHPMDFDPDDKLTFAAGYGNYKGKNAAAVGAFYRPDEKVMLSVGGTFGNGENMVNAGISFSLDRTARVSNSRTAMAKEIVDLRANVANLTALVGQLTAGMGGTIEMDRMKLFPDVPENHWAYEYIGRLAAAGIVEGYPDGMFNGNRMMSRYEFAAMLYRALEKGVKLDHKLVREFEPEMGRIHVARISGADGDRGKIERVRVYGGDNRDHYGSKLK
ncbi:YadA-like family protein [Phascolarctobacterium sp. Marseille-Q4147]|uniref:YadA-like family protein n=1 Tax=Phascolarctobacterium sp. Marseille-Q4147 TaxID=2823317 RepID=UPI001B3386AC|nr:YadA-like family protein [Phascolarctobacterium sp. Marseille-Q4147]QTV77780.1 YadA-like family protein [Phascolarctobacterium sp. Marseille-Q4147]